MSDPGTLITAIDKASKFGNTTWFTAIIDKATGFKISQWAAEGEVRKKMLHDEYEKAKSQGIMGMQYIEYMRSTENLLNTAVKTAKHLKSDEPNKIKMDNDFFWNLIDHSKSISTEEMQELIAKILAQEYTKPGSYSRKTLQILKSIDKEDLRTFEFFCSFLVDGGRFPAFVFSKGARKAWLVEHLPIYHSLFLELQNLGLFYHNVIHDHHDLALDVERISYFGRQIVLTKLNRHKTSGFNYPPYYSLSESGLDILTHLKPQPYREYFEYLIENIRVENYSTSSD
ncbi:DUF2806 domain-containing protein [Flagellimonas sp.]|uniref:DUF2806 domain-containing protein n=1 Tax=Flagellimonas sp. TaxID=2058762 RepID=UPI003F49EEC2